MKFPEPLESRMYGDPMEVLSAKQSEAANRANRSARRPAPKPKVRCEGEWSDARKAAEALFDTP